MRNALLKTFPAVDSPCFDLQGVPNVEEEAQGSGSEADKHGEDCPGGTGRGPSCEESRDCRREKDNELRQLSSILFEDTMVPNIE